MTLVSFASIFSLSPKRNFFDDGTAVRKLAYVAHQELGENYDCTVEASNVAEQLEKGV